MVYMADILIEVINNYLPVKNNVEYAQEKFMQTSKMSKKAMDMIFNNSDLAPIQEHLSYKNIDELKALLIELAYGKVI